MKNNLSPNRGAHSFASQAHQKIIRSAGGSAKKMSGKEMLFFICGDGRAEFPGAKLVRWFLPIMLSLGCSISSAQIEPNAGRWKTWVLTSGDQLRLPQPPDEAATRAEIAQLKDIAKQRDAGTLERISWWNAGPPGYRWTTIAIPPGPASATLHSRIMVTVGCNL